jgi:hypothetical protein
MRRLRDYQNKIMQIEFKFTTFLLENYSVQLSGRLSCEVIDKLANDVPLALMQG